MDDQVPEIDILCRHLESLVHTVVYRSKTTNQPTNQNNQPKVFWPRTNEKTGVSKHCGVRACAECHAHYKWTTASQTVQPHRLGVVLVDSRAVLVVDPEVELRDRRESTTRPSQQVPESANVLLV
jgi:hypothetical protein